VSAHRQHIEDCMDFVRAEMNLMGELDGAERASDVESYTNELIAILAQKSASVSALQLRVTQFRRLLQAAMEAQ
ncbi:hypothetical protein H632_c5101p0, partial [Helicosporidium sp. ATCC 50920]